MDAGHCGLGALLDDAAPVRDRCGLPQIHEVNQGEANQQHTTDQNSHSPTGKLDDSSTLGMREPSRESEHRLESAVLGNLGSLIGPMLKPAKVVLVSFAAPD